MYQDPRFPGGYPNQNYPNQNYQNYQNYPNPNLPDPRSKLKAPAISLIIVSAINFLCSLFWIFSWISAFVVEKEPHHFGSESEKMGYYFGAIAPFVVSVVSLVVAPVILVGAIKMIRARSYSFAKMAALLTAIPVTSVCCLLGLPLGIWAYSTLNRPEVKASFSD